MKHIKHRWYFGVLCFGAVGILGLSISPGESVSRPRSLSPREMSRIYGFGEGTGCDQAENSACDTSRNTRTCWQKTVRGRNACAKSTGKLYSGNPTYSCANAQNTKVKDYEEIDCYKSDASFKEGAGTAGFQCVDPDCEPDAPEEYQCGQCYLESTSSWTTVDSCVCQDP